MEPKTYIQQCHSGKTRIYKGKLPPEQNGPYWEITQEPMRSSAQIEKKLPVIWWVSVVTIAATIISAVIYWII